MISLESYLLVSSVLFVLGVISIISRRHAIAVLMGVELVLNAANINLVAFNHYNGGALSGHIFTIFVIVLAAAEAAVALAIILNLYYRRASVNVDDINSLQG
ncbi:MAG TPA: NADH-quinone oxidoreductase subunit NuoK [Candidatus Marinimicrobia bacterium]|nr:NADH-quinone oxidoreductase subunit NuoK [Candidatus Neomarinimicrobiota bacterium]